MKYYIDEKREKIKITGSKRRIRRFAKYLIEEVDGNLVKNLESIKLDKSIKAFDLNNYQRLYLEEKVINYIPTVWNPGEREFHFKIMKGHYQRAREGFERGQKNNLFKIFSK